MKQLRELNPAELTLEQKMGLVVCPNLSYRQGDLEDIMEMIRNHALGAVWIQPAAPNRDAIIRRIRETADYPIMILCDSEQGVGEYIVPQQISITAAGAKSEYAYSFGRITAVQLHEMGYNTVCIPVVDMARRNAPCGHVTRTFGGDIPTVTRLAGAVAQGVHDGGLLTVAKHYPGNGDVPGAAYRPWDSHMRETNLDLDREQLLENNLVPYIELYRQGLLDGAMVGHKLVPKIDPDRPASLSKKLTALLREQGFDGFLITDALCMMGVVLKYGQMPPNPMCIGAGNDLALPWTIPIPEVMEGMRDGFAKGLFTEEDLNEAVRHVLEAQHRVTLLKVPDEHAPRPEDVANFNRITEDCIAAVCDEGVPSHISREGHHLFIIMTDGTVDLEDDSEYLPGPRDWYFPKRIAARLRDLFPGCGVDTMPQFPSANDTMLMYDKQIPYDDVVFITFAQSGAYLGRECLTSRIVDFMDALQSTDRIVAQLHFGNPFVAADAPHFPCVLLGYCSEPCVNHALEILAGNAPANGIVPYDVKFKEKGYVFS